MSHCGASSFVHHHADSSRNLSTSFDMAYRFRQGLYPAAVCHYKIECILRVQADTMLSSRTYVVAASVRSQIKLA